MDQKIKHGFGEARFVSEEETGKIGKVEMKNAGEVTKDARLKSTAAAHMKLWAIIASILVLLWSCAVQLATLGDKCVTQKYRSFTSYFPPPERTYESNGYLMVSLNGGLNQMRSGICDMVAIARFLNATLIVPKLDNTSFWHDHSSFKDIFDVDHFITSLRNEVQILKELPKESESIYSITPVLWSSLSYYTRKILPSIKKHKVLHLLKADARLANNGIPENIQKLRCHANYEALRFSNHIEEMGRKIVKRLRQKGPFLALHLRFEMDMLSFTGCTEGLTHKEVVELIQMRDSYPWWQTRSNPKKRRAAGLCPLTPDETALALQALGIDRDIQIYIASGNIYGGESRLARLKEAYPNQVKKETLLDPSELRPFLNHSNQMAALDYIVSLESDIFVPTYEGYMARAVEGHRRYLGFRTTITIEKRLLVSLIDQYKIGRLSWEEFAFIMKAAHRDHMGKPSKRLRIPGRPKDEDYFYSNPQECLPQVIES